MLEIVGATMPDEVGGVPQMPIHGTSLLETFDSRDGRLHRDVQHFDYNAFHDHCLLAWEMPLSPGRKDPFSPRC